MNSQSWDAFICHASEDKDDFVLPLIRALEKRSLKVWYDVGVLSIGASLRRSIEHGLTDSKYGVVILSPAFFSKEWPQKELDALASLENEPGSRILPIWYKLSYEDVKIYSPLLCDRYALRHTQGIDDISEKLAEKILKGKEIIQDRSSIEMSNIDQQKIYFINCIRCGKIIEVANPRIGLTPQKVIARDYNEIETSNITMIGLGCPSCKFHIFVKFIYS